jgi:chorismate synthase
MPNPPLDPAPRTASGTTLTLPPVEIRPLRTHRERTACVELQHETWGANFSERVPAALLTIAQRLGGIAAGAFDPSDRLVGFVFGLTGVENGQLVHWSDMLAVRAEFRDHGIGRRLKEFQRETLVGIGVRRIYWTFDPLVARNAHFNFNRLGVRVVEYVPDMYGPDTNSALHQGLGTDRFIVVRYIAPGTQDDPPPPPSLETARLVPLLNPVHDHTPSLAALPDDPRDPMLRIAIPLAIDRIQQADLSLAGRWRAVTRQAFLWSLHHGYRVHGFVRDDTANLGYYLLAAAPHRSTP